MKPPAFSEALILAGGLGTRLRPVVANAPKGLAPVAGRPFLEWQIDALRSRGVTRIVMAIGYGADQIREHFGPGHAGLEMVYSVESDPLGTGGAIRQALSLCREPHVLVLNGDTFLEFDPTLLRAALHPPLAVVMVLARVPDISRYGSVEWNPDGRVFAFNEKGGLGGGWINGGVYAMDRVRMEPFWPPEQAFSLEKAVMPALAANEMLGSVTTEGFFLDIGTPEDFARAQRLFPLRINDS